MKTKVLSYRAIIEKDGKYYHGYIPSLPGCHTQGDTIEETRDNLREAAELQLSVMRDHHLEIPTEKGWEFIETFKIDYA